MHVYIIVIRLNGKLKKQCDELRAIEDDKSISVLIRNCENTLNEKCNNIQKLLHMKKALDLDHCIEFVKQEMLTKKSDFLCHCRQN